MKRSFKILLIGWIAAVLLGGAWFVNSVHADEQDYYYRLKKSWQYMQRVYEQLNMHYVEEIDPYPLIKSGIDGMLEKLDPYTVFIEEDGDRRLQIITTGKYGGLGMEISMRDKKVTVISPMENSPAKRAGILAGDIIEKIDDLELRGLSIDEVSKKLRGEVGTEIKLVLKRPGFEPPIELTLKREEIVIEDVGYAGFVEPGVAYVSLNGFTEKAAVELRNAILDLQKQGPIRSFILDLRGNPGGLLESAVDVVNLFVEKDELVVSTKGFREGEVKFYTDKKPLLPDVPLAVLVDEGSASASEIVAGALQDLDRAVIVGQPTFGKGLVQKVYTIDKESDAKIKITTAKYYIPSGRCIQKKDYSEDNDVIFPHKKTGNEEHPSHIYYTRNKREVLDQGGIYPDMEVEGDSINYVFIELIRQNMFFDYAVQYHLDHPQWQGEFKIDDKICQQFHDFLKAKNFQYDMEGTQELQKLEKIASKKEFSDEILGLIGQLKVKLENEKDRDFQDNRPVIRRYLKMELAEKYFGKKTRDQYSIEFDPQVKEARLLIKDQQRYVKILANK